MNLLVSFSDDGFSCPVCRDIFKKPVLLPCCHSFCKACVREWWKHKGKKECPVCREEAPNDDLPAILALQNLCETYIKEKRRKMDPSEAAAESLTVLRERLKAFGEVKANCDRAAEHIEAQARRTEAGVKAQFGKLREFLAAEEEARLAALREEEERKARTMREKIAELTGEIRTISETIAAIEEELRAPSSRRGGVSSFMQSHNEVVERVQFQLGEPRQPQGALIDSHKHLGNLAFSVWEKMKDLVSYAPVVLDPNTAHPELALSDDLTSMRRMTGGDKQHDDLLLPDNPERFDYYFCVLGSEGFDSGTKVWNVEVGDNTDWSLGVLSESRNRTGRKGDKGEQYWGIGLDDGGYRAQTRPEYYASWSFTELAVRQKPRRVRVQLDWDAGKLSFSDADTNALLHSFDHAFAGVLLPYMYNGDVTLPLRLLPRKIGVYNHNATRS